MAKLKSRRDKLTEQIKKAQYEVDHIDYALSKFEKTNTKQRKAITTGKTLKEQIVEILHEAGGEGLSAREIFKKLSKSSNKSNYKTILARLAELNNSPKSGVEKYGSFQHAIYRCSNE